MKEHNCICTALSWSQENPTTWRWICTLLHLSTATMPSKSLRCRIDCISGQGLVFRSPWSSSPLHTCTHHFQPSILYPGGHGGDGLAVGLDDPSGLSNLNKSMILCLLQISCLVKRKLSHSLDNSMPQSHPQRVRRNHSTCCRLAPQVQAFLDTT